MVSVFTQISSGPGIPNVEMKPFSGSDDDLLQHEEIQNDDEVYENYITRYAVYLKMEQFNDKIKNGSHRTEQPVRSNIGVSF